MSNILTASGVSKSFGGVNAVQDFNIELPKGVIHGIIGPNGAGKTTIFNLLSHIYPVDSGAITFLGKDITAETQISVSRMGLSRTFQNTRLFPGLSVLDNVKVGIDSAGKYSIFEAMFMLPRRWKEEKRIADEAKSCLDVLHLSKYADDRPSN
ncbi:MAG TPA: ATP-binding cassette domain-containing protein, partial [Feifaniaceae bacterium]|nr:ATP-binding cassette domain-containing protein [Feifaniaceae bacterium]